jgi:hypothetical protein
LPAKVGTKRTWAQSREQMSTVQSGGAIGHKSVRFDMAGELARSVNGSVLQVLKQWEISMEYWQRWT